MSEETLVAERLRRVEHELGEITEQVSRLRRSVRSSDTVRHGTKLVGLSEVIELTGRPSATVRLYRSQGKLPNPVAELNCGPIWLQSDIELWHKQNRNGKKRDA